MGGDVADERGAPWVLVQELAERVAPAACRRRRFQRAPGAPGAVRPERMTKPSCNPGRHSLEWRSNSSPGRGQCQHHKGARMKRLAFISATAVAAALAFAGGASAAPLPTFNIALNGVNGISVSGSEVTGAVTIVSTFSGKAPKGPNANTPAWGIVRLDDGVTLQQAVAAVTKARGDLNALDGLATLFASAGAPGTVETAFAEPGDYVALNETGNGQPGVAQFVVTASASPATLPTPQATETSIEFGFRGPTTLHDGELVRFQNGGYLVHMDIAAGAKNKATGKKLVAALRANSKG